MIEREIASVKCIAALIVTVLLLACLLSGCAGRDADAQADITGTYRLQSINGLEPLTYMAQQAGAAGLDPVELGLDQVASEDLETVVLNSDGSARIEEFVPGQGMMTADGTWIREGDWVSVTVDNRSFEFALRGGDLVLEAEGADGTVTLVMSR